MTVICQARSVALEKIYVVEIAADMLKFSILLLLLWACIDLPMIDALACNGDPQFCGLKVDQYTFAGAHNAGSALRFPALWRGTSLVAPQCFIRSQDQNFQQLLDGDIRFLDIDNCWEWEQLSSCHGNAWTGIMKDGLEQLRTWMNANPNDIVMIHFNWDTDDDKKSTIASAIKEMLEARFVSGCGVEMSTYYHTHNQTWPTLKEAIESNQRLFVLLDNGLAGPIGRPSWAHVTSLTGSGTEKYNFYRPSYESLDVVVEDDCKPIIQNARDTCNIAEYKLVDVAAYGASGLCLPDIAYRCSAHYAAAVDACYEERKKLSKTVNIITGDFATDSGRANIPAQAQRINLKNVADFL